ncbi:MAG: autotransporter-associated beta strand repeat-containing protein [Tepidisphaeraceae bacterium]
MLLNGAVATTVLALGLANPQAACGEIKTFSDTASDWFAPGNWTPAGVPTLDDDVHISGGAAAMSLTGDLTIQSILFDSVTSRTLGNATSGSSDAIITLTNVPNSGTGTPTFITVTGGGTFTIAGANIGSSGAGTGKLALQIGQAGEFNVSAGSTLDISAAIGETGGSRDLTLSGAGTTILSGTSTYSGQTKVGSIRARGGFVELTGRLVNTSGIEIGSGATLTIDNSSAVLNDRINDTAPVEVSHGTVRMIGDGSVPVIENFGALVIEDRISNIEFADCRLDAMSSGEMRFASLDRRDGFLDFNVEAGSAISFASPPSMSNGILERAIYNGQDWAQVDALSGVVSAFTAYETSTNPLVWSPQSNVLVDGAAPVIIGTGKTINTIKLSNGGSIIANGALSTDGILVTGGDSSITGSGMLTAKTGTPNITVRPIVLDPTFEFVISVPITDNGSPVSLIKSGDGTLVLTANNPLTGTTYIARGKIRLDFGSIGDSLLQIGGDGTLEVGGNSGVGGTFAIGGLSGSGKVSISSFNFMRVASSASTTFTGEITGAGGLTKAGSGTLSLSGNNNYSGLTTVEEGALAFGGSSGTGDLLIGTAVTFPFSKVLIKWPEDDEIASSRQVSLGGGLPTIDVASGKTVTVHAGINETLPFATLHKTGGGTLELLGNSTYSGATVLEGGTVRLTGTAGALSNTSSVTLDKGIVFQIGGNEGNTSRIADSAPIVMNGGTLELIAGATVVTEDVGVLRLTGGGNIVKTTVPVGAANGTIRFTGSDFEGRKGGTINFEVDATGPVIFTAPPALPNGIMGAFATHNGSDWATINSSTGEVIAYSGYAIDPNPATWTAAQNVSLASNVIVSSDAEVNTLKLSGTSSVEIASAAAKLKTGGIIAGSGSIPEITGAGKLTAPAGVQELVVHAHGTGGSFKIAAPIADNGGPLSLIKAGDGTLVLSGDNTYTGATKVNRGVLKTFFQTGDRPTQSQFSILIDSTLDITAHNQTIGSLSGEGKVLLGESTLIVGLNEQSSTFNGEFVGTAGAGGGGGGGITKIGAGTLTLGGEINTPGELHVQNGSVRIDALEDRLQAFGLIASVRLGGATTGGVVKITGGDRSRAVDIPITLEAGGGTIAASGNVTFSGPIGGSGGLTVRHSGPGTIYNIDIESLEFTSPNPYTGATTIEGVDVVLSGDGRLTATPSITIASGGKLTCEVRSGTIKLPSAAIFLDGGTLEDQNLGTSAHTEDRYLLGLRVYDSAVVYSVGDTAIQNQIIYQALQVSPGAMGNFKLTPNNHVFFTTAPPLSNGIIAPGVRFNDTDYATRNPATGEVIAYSGYETDPNPLNWAATDNVSIDTDVTIAQNTEVNTLRRAPAAVARSAGLELGVRLTTSGILFANDGDSITGPGTITAKGVAGTYPVVVVVSDADGDTSSDRATISAPFVDNGANPVTLLKGGGGTLVLTADSTHTGDTVIGGGVLELAPGVDLASSTVDLDANGRVEVMGPTTIGGLKGGALKRFGMGGETTPNAPLRVGSNNQSTTFQGDIFGVVSLTKIGTGTLTLTGENSYTGQTVVESGTLDLDRDGSLSDTSEVTVSGTLAFKEFSPREDQLKSNPRHRRIAPSAPIRMEGGTLEVTFGAGLGRTDVQDLGALRSASGSSTVTTTAESGTSGAVRFASLTRDSGSNINWSFQGDGSVAFVTPPALSNGIIGPWATANGQNWARTNQLDNSVSVYDLYQTSADPNDWLPSDNISIDGPRTLTGDKTVNTIKFISSSTGDIILNYDNLQTRGILVTNNGSGISGVGGGLTAPAGVAELIVHVPTAGNTFTIGTPIINNSGAVSLVKAGAGTLVLDAPSTHTGPTYINQGTVQARDFADMIDSTLNLTDDGILQLTAGTTPLTIGGLSGGGEVQLARGIIVGKPAGGTTATYSGRISGAGDFELRGSGTTPLAGSLRLTGENTFTGGMIVEDGTLILDGEGSLLSISSLSVRRGRVSVKQGFFSAGYKARLNNTAGITLTGGTLEFETAGAFIANDNVGPLILNGGAAKTGYKQSDIMFGGGVTRLERATLNFNITDGGSASFTTPPSLTNGIIGGWATVNDSDWASIEPGMGKVVAYTGYTTNPDPTTWTASQNVETGSNVMISSDAEANTLKLAPGSVTLGPGATLRAKGIIKIKGGAGSPSSISGPGSLTAPAGQSELIVHNPDTLNSYSINVDARDNGMPLSLIKSGAGTLVLSGNNTYSGPTVVNEGTVEVSGADNLGDASATNQLVLNGGALRLSGGRQTGQNGRMIRVNPGGGTIDTNGFDMTFGQLVWNGELQKQGAGTLKLRLPTGNAQEGVLTTEMRITGGVIQAEPRLPANVATRITSLTIEPGAKFDLTDNKLILRDMPVGTFAAGAYGGVSGLVDAGRGSASNAQWNGSGIITSDTRAVNNNDLTSIGVIDASDRFPGGETTTALFAGQTVLGSDTLVMFTWGGDANLDGKINIDDYGQIDFNVGSSGSVFGWYNGDFNYDGKINIDDYGIIDFNVTAQTGTFPTAGSLGGVIEGVAAVPEPGGGIVLLGLAAAVGGRRCRSARAARR